MTKTLMSGDQAIARGVWEAGVVFAASYPGTPATEILESLAHYPDIHLLRFTYRDDDPVQAKIESIARRIYGADGVDFSEEAERKIAQFEAMGFGRLPVCMAKTHLSLSHDPRLKGRPRDWRLPVRDVRLSAGAGFLYALCGDIMTMPGLPSRPAGENVDIGSDGTVVGLF